MKNTTLRILCISLLIFSAIGFAQTVPLETRTIFLPSGEHVVSRATAPAMEGVYGLVLFSPLEPLTSEQQSQLRQNGVRLIEYLGQNTWWARVKEGADMKDVSLFAMQKYQPGMTITSGAKRLCENSSAVNGIPLVISFMPDVSEAKMKKALDELAVEKGSYQLLYNNRARIKISSSKVKEILLSQDILSVETGGRQRRLLNKKAAILSKTDQARSRYNLSGKGIAVGVWDGGKIYNHKELSARITYAKNSAVDAHATHVAGTIGATGKRKRAKGMAPQVRIISYDYFDDIHTEMSNSKAKYDVLLTNNSYGYPNGWEWEDEWIWYGDEYFGQYSSESKAFDKIVIDKGITVVFAAGNDREDTGPNKGNSKSSAGNQLQAEAERKRDGPYVCVGEESSAKNVIAVGALADNGKMSSYSSWGPTLDGRIKPEITANGNKVYSTLKNNSYGRYSGTSMASPVVTGSLALVAEFWKKEKGQSIPADVVRGLVAIAAKDAGRPGPDYSYGFGILDTEKMVKIIDDDGLDSGIFYGTINSSKDRKTFTFNAGGRAESLAVVLAWLDPPASVNARPALINNLNLIAESPSRAKNYPWILDKNKPEQNAKKGVNDLDNIELIQVKSPESGRWTFTVSAGNSRLQGSQKFVVIVYQQ